MAQAIVDRARGVLGDLGPSIGCSEKRSKARPAKVLGRGAGLRIDQLQFVAAADDELGCRPSG